MIDLPFIEKVKLDKLAQTRLKYSNKVIVITKFELQLSMMNLIA